MAMTTQQVVESIEIKWKNSQHKFLPLPRDLQTYLNLHVPPHAWTSANESPALILLNT